MPPLPPRSPCLPSACGAPAPSTAVNPGEWRWACTLRASTAHRTCAEPGPKCASPPLLAWVGNCGRRPAHRKRSMGMGTAEVKGASHVLRYEGHAKRTCSGPHTRRPRGTTHGMTHVIDLPAVGGSQSVVELNRLAVPPRNSVRWGLAARAMARERFGIGRFAREWERLFERVSGRS